jgi:hypothetical protein
MSNTDAPEFKENYKEPILSLIESIQFCHFSTQNTKEVTSKRKTHQSNTKKSLNEEGKKK